MIASNTVSNKGVSTKGGGSGVKKLSVTELRARRAKSLCYYSDEKYNLGHKFKTNYCLLVGVDELNEVLEHVKENNVIEATEEAKGDLNFTKFS